MISYNLESIKVEVKACMNYTNQKIVCQKCTEACPANVIDLQNKLPVINHTKCIDCGNCIGICPTLVFDFYHKNYVELSREIKNNPEAKITCNELVEYQEGIKIPCYLNLDLSLLLQYSINKETIIFYTGKCNDCSKSEYFSIEQHFGKLNQELKELNIEVAIKTTNQNPNVEGDKILNGLSRREALQKISFTALSRLLLGKEIKDKPERATAAKELMLEARVKFKRNLFNECIKLYSPEKKPLEFLPLEQFTNIEINANCSGCNVCERICPTNAIYWQNSNNESKLIFSIRECIGCRKCEACPEQAIKFHPVSYKEYSDKEKRALITYKLKQCTECGETFRTKQDANICIFCNSQKDKDSKRFFVHKLI